MKKLLIGLLVLGSISSFASTLSASFSIYSLEAPLFAKPNAVTPSDRGEKIKIKASLENAHAFCISKGYQISTSHSETTFTDKYVASKITPTAEVAGTTSPSKSKYMDTVSCEREIL